MAQFFIHRPVFAWVIALFILVMGGVALTQMDMKQQSKYGYGDPGYYYAEYKKYYVS